MKRKIIWRLILLAIFMLSMSISYISIKDYRDNEVYTFADITENLGGECIRDIYGDFERYKDKHFIRYTGGKINSEKRNLTEICDTSGAVIYTMETVNISKQVVIIINFNTGEHKGKREAWVCVE